LESKLLHFSRSANLSLQLSTLLEASNQFYIYSHLTLEVLVLKHLHERYQILHRDISPNNLLLIRPNVEGGARSGMLIDFDYAALTQAIGPRSISNGFRTVCLSICMFYLIY
jgi:serine/threonine protein kinase